MGLVSLIRQGYQYAPRLLAGAEAVQTRIMGQRATVLEGPDAARLFYDETRLQRTGAVPRPVRATLFGEGGVQTLDDAAHRRRKELFLQVTRPSAVVSLAALADERWAEAVDRWVDSDRVVLFDEAVKVFGAAVLPWAGVPVSDVIAGRRAFELAQLVDGFGNDLRAHLTARAARPRVERWAGALIESVRAGSVTPPEDSAAVLIARHRDASGALLPRSVAAVELINVVRPTVAVAWYVAFAALAVPAWRTRVLASPADLHAFCLEVRRYFPITPVLGARARLDFSWHGHRFRRGQLVLLDVYGTDHDPALWPGSFDPDRFLDHSPGPYDYLPHGGGDPAHGHRCPGEDIAHVLLAGAVRTLAGLSYDLPPQDLSVPLERMPTSPRSGVVLTSVAKLRERATV